jgi:phage FluMu gp28-like protein
MQRAVLLPYQKRWVACEAPFAVYLKSRRIGISWAEALWSVRRRLTHRIDHLFVSANHNTACEFIRYCGRWCEVLNLAVQAEVVDLNGTTTQSIMMPNGARIMALSSNPTALRGQGGDVTLDELAFHPFADEMYTAAQPVRQWGGVLRLISTPAGPETTFSKIVQAAPDNRFEKFRTTLLDAVAQGLAERVPGEHQQLPPAERDAAFIETIKQTCLSDAAFRQEYLCEDISAETIITPAQYDRCILKGFDVPSELDHKKKYGLLYCGVDVARAVGGNLTVVWVVERGEDQNAPEHLRECYRTVALKTMQGMSFPMQTEIISRFLSHPSVHKCCVDATGMGVALSDELVAKFGSRVEPVMLNRNNKSIMVERVARHVYQERVSLPNDQTIKSDLCAMRRVPLTGGGYRYEGSSGDSHCDAYMALSLALEAADAKPFRVLAA